MNFDTVSCKKMFLILLLMYLIMPLGVNAQETTDRFPIHNCKPQEGIWVKSNGENICFTCPTRTMLESSFTGMKLPRGCKVDKEGVFLKLSDYEKLRISQEYVFEIDKYQESIDQLKFIVNDRLDQTILILSKSEKEKDDMLKNIQMLQNQKIKLETQLEISLWVGGIALGVVLIESSILLYQLFN